MTQELTRRQALQTIGGLAGLAIGTTSCTSMNRYDVGGAVLPGFLGDLSRTKGNRTYMDEKLEQINGDQNPYRSAVRARYQAGLHSKDNLVFTANSISKKFYYDSYPITRAGHNRVFDRNCHGVKNIFDNDEKIVIGWQVGTSGLPKKGEENNIKLYEQKNNSYHQILAVNLNNSRGRMLFEKIYVRHGVLNLTKAALGNKKIDLCAGNRVLATSYLKIIDRDAPKQAPIRKQTNSEIISALKDLEDLKANRALTDSQYNSMRSELMKDFPRTNNNLPLEKKITPIEQKRTLSPIYQDIPKLKDMPLLE